MTLTTDFFVGTATVDLTTSASADAFYAWKSTCAVLQVTGTMPPPLSAVPIYFIAKQNVPLNVVASSIVYSNVVTMTV